MIDLRSPFEYVPIKIGRYRLSHDIKNQQFVLLENNFGWMAYDQTSHWQAKEFCIEVNLAKGVCITTGLGLGILQGLLCLKEEVSKVIVYEKSKEVIDIFYKIVEFNKFDISKLTIINQDADTLSQQQADFLFADHFEKEPRKSIIEKVKKLSLNNNFKTVWYWPAVNHFLRFSISKKLEFNQLSYSIWRSAVEIPNLPEQLDELHFSYINVLNDVYLNEAGNVNGLRNAYNVLEQKDKLKKLSQTISST